MTPDEHAALMRSRVTQVAEQAAQAAQAVAERSAQRVAVLAARAQQTSVRVMRSGEAVTMRVDTSSRALAAEIRRWAADSERGVELAKEVRGVRT